jgi:high-affinity Fe2+/Pb2+ permease
VSFQGVADVSFGQFFLAVVLAAGLSMWVYWHASRHRSRHATAWGVATFLFAGIALPLYLIHYYATRRRR